LTVKNCTLIDSGYMFILSIEYILQDARCCASCGLMLPCKTMKKIKDSSHAPQFLCKHCVKVIQKGLIQCFKIFTIFFFNVRWFK